MSLLRKRYELDFVKRYEFCYSKRYDMIAILKRRSLITTRERIITYEVIITCHKGSSSRSYETWGSRKGNHNCDFVAC